MKNPANDWLNGKISMGKMIQLIPEKRDLVGAIMNAMNDRVNDLKIDLTAEKGKAKRDCRNAQRSEDKSAESARHRAFVECLIKLQWHLGSALDNTSAGEMIYGTHKTNPPG